MSASTTHPGPRPHPHAHDPTPAPGPAPAVVADMLQCRRIQVSREKRPLSFFLTLSKKFLLTDKMIELSGLGLAVTTVVTIAEILKSHNLVSIKHVKTSLVDPHPDGHTMAPKAKIQIWIEKTAQFDQVVPSFGYQMRGGNNPSSNLNATSPNPSTSAVSTPSPVADPDQAHTQAQAQGEVGDVVNNKGHGLYHHHHHHHHHHGQGSEPKGSTGAIEGSTDAGAGAADAAAAAAGAGAVSQTSMGADPADSKGNEGGTSQDQSYEHE